MEISTDVFFKDLPVITRQLRHFNIAENDTITMCLLLSFLTEADQIEAKKNGTETLKHSARERDISLEHCLPLAAIAGVGI